MRRKRRSVILILLAIGTSIIAQAQDSFKLENIDPYKKYYELRTAAFEKIANKNLVEGAKLLEQAFCVQYPFTSDIEKLLVIYKTIGDTASYGKTIKLLASTLNAHEVQQTVASRQFRYFTLYDHPDTVVMKRLRTYFKELAIPQREDIGLEKVKSAERTIAELRYEMGEMECDINQVLCGELDVVTLGWRISAFHFMDYLRKGNFINRNECSSWDNTLAVSIIHMLLSLHIDEAEEMFKLLFEQVRIGNIEADQFANWYDMFYYRKGTECTRFGTAGELDESFLPEFVVSVQYENIDIVNKSRVAIGLPSLDVQQKANALFGVKMRYVYKECKP
jgi:hypothetical protein